MAMESQRQSSKFHEKYAIELHAIADDFHSEVTRTYMHNIARMHEELARRLRVLEEDELELMSYPTRRWW